MHGRSLMLHRGRGLIVDISDFLKPEPCRAWQDLRWVMVGRRPGKRALLAPSAEGSGDEDQP